MNDLQSLRERVEKADGPSRELDALIAVEILGYREIDDGVFDGVNFWWTVNNDDGDDYGNKAQTLPHYTASIDSAVALIERKLPGAFWSVTNAAIKPRAIVFMPSPISRGQAPQKHRSAPTPALALISALLSSLETHNGEPRK